MTIQCFMPVYNEADILPYVLAHLREQGIGAIHILDGWSTDGSYEFAASVLGVTVERYPDPDTGVWHYRQALKHIEDLAQASGAGWCLLSDADEWRRSIVPGERLADGVACLDAEGYNVIDSKVYAFFPTDNGWHGDPEAYFRYYNTTDMICKLPQHKFWKNDVRVNLHDSGGHILQRPGRRIAPERWIMKHYPFRNQEQAKRRIGYRLARRSQIEHSQGWGVHYDQYPPGFDFLWKPEELDSIPGPDLLWNP